MKTVGRSIAVSVEHVRGWGRRVCEGIAAYSHDCGNWHLAMIDNTMPSSAALKRFDGFLWSVTDESVAEVLLATGKPVIDLVSDGRYSGTISVGADHLACGQLAARTFLSQRFSYFAYFGWKGLRFSDARQASYCRALQLNHYDCKVYLSSPRTLRQYLNRDVLREKFMLPSDAKAVGRWARRLPKPTAVFCANDQRAWQLAEICRLQGIRIPEDVAILGADNDPLPCLFTTTSISSVDTDTFETGRRAAEVLDCLIEGRPCPGLRNGKVLVKPRGVESRMSTAVYPVEPRWLAEALAFIRTNVVQSLTADDVVRHVGRSYSSVESTFKKVLNSTVQKEIMSARLDMADHMLKTSALSVAEIAARAGFGSAQYFNRCFVARHGVAPGKWKEKAV